MEEIIFTERQIKHLVDALRAHERASKAGFAKWLADHIDEAGTEEYMEKCKKASGVYHEIAEIRRILGDTPPVHVQHRKK